MTTTDPLSDRLLVVSDLARALFHHLAEDAAQRGVRVEHHRQAFYPYDTAERRELLDHGLLRLLDERGLFEMADSRDFPRVTLDPGLEPSDAATGLQCTATGLPAGIPKRSGKHKLPRLPQVEKPSPGYELDRWLMTRGLGSTLGNHR